jgi:polysaccharide biosynthesis transport protein
MAGTRPEGTAMSNDLQSFFGDRLRPGDLWPMLRRSWWLVLASLVISLGAAVLVSVVSPREYRATATIRIVPTSGQEVQSREVLDLDVRGFQEVERFYRTQVQLFKSAAFAERVAAEYEARTGQEVEPGRVRGGMEVFPLERSQLMQVAFTDSDPERAAVLANLAARTFVADNIEWRRAMARDANRWVEERIGEIERRREAAVQRLLAYKAEHNIIDREDGRSALSARMDALETAYGEVSAERVLLSSRLTNHRGLLRSGDIEALAGQGDLPLSPVLKQRYADVRADLAVAAGRYGAKHPEYQRIQAKVQQIEAQLANEVREAIRTEQARLEMLEAQEERLAAERRLTKDEVLEQQRLSAEYRELRRQLAQIEETHKTLLRRKDELELSAETNLNNAQAVDEARAPKSFIRPRISLILASGLVVGLLVGIALAVLRGLLDETILDPKDIETYIRMPLLGVLPHVQTSDLDHPELMVHYEPRSSVAEAVRGVRTVASTRSDGTPVRRILVTSSIASEGKTSVAVSLAISFARQGRRTLILEGDHRRPRLHKVFELPRDAAGVTDMLVERVDLPSAAVQTAIDNLHVITRGRTDHGTVELLTGEATPRLLDRLDEVYDVVIIDSPPSAAVSDAITLSRYVDGVLLVVRSGKVSRSLVRHTVRRLEQVGAHIIGLVVNDFTTSRLSGRYTYYYDQRYYYEEEREDGSDEGEAAK